MAGEFDVGALLSGLGGAGAAGMGGGAGGGSFGGMDFFQKLMAATADPIAKDQLLTQLATSGVAPPPIAPDARLAPMAPATPLMPTTPVSTPAAPNPLLTGEMPPPVSVGPTPLQATVAGLNSPQAYPTSVPGGAGDETNKPLPLGQLLAGAQTAMKGMEQPQQQRQVAPSPGGAAGHGSAALSKAPGYLPTDVSARREQARKSLGMLLGGR